MFTGLVEELGRVKNISRGKRSVRLTVEAEKALTGAKVGDSIAVSGVCLTVTALGVDFFTADVMPETVDRTILAKLKVGDSVNLERPLQVGGRLDGHIVSGHVDGMGVIAAKNSDKNAIIIRIKAQEEIMRYVVKKGSIAVDGISLTVADCGGDWLTVSLIPHTAAVTGLGAKKQGDYVNLETDIIGKYVEKLLGNFSKNDKNEKNELDWDFFSRNGF